MVAASKHHYNPNKIDAVLLECSRATHMYPKNQQQQWLPGGKGYADARDIIFEAVAGVYIDTASDSRTREVREAQVCQLLTWLNPEVPIHQNPKDEIDEIKMELAIGFDDAYFNDLRIGDRDKFLIKLGNKGIKFFDILGTEEGQLSSEAMGRLIATIESGSDGDLIKNRLRQFVEELNLQDTNDPKILRTGVYTGDSLQYQKLAVIFRHLEINKARIRQSAKKRFNQYKIVGAMKTARDVLRTGVWEEDTMADFVYFAQQCLLQHDELVRRGRPQYP